MKNWYKEKLGWKALKDIEDIVFFKLNGLILSLFPAHELAKDATIEQSGQGFKSIEHLKTFGKRALRFKEPTVH